MLLSEQSAWGAFTSMSYDAVRNEITRIDGRGWPTTNTYDTLDRIQISQAPDGALTTHQYDANSREIALWNRASLVTNTYDAVGQTLMVAAQSVIDGTVATLSYSLDSVGNRTLMVDGEGHRTTYAYLAPMTLNQLYSVKITPPCETNLTEVDFDNLGRLYQIHLNNANFEEVRFYPNGWPVYRQYILNGVGQGVFNPGFDAAGNQTVLGEQVGTTGSINTHTFLTYDRANQLLSEIRQDIPGYANTFTYDGVGNRMTQNSLGVRTTYQYPRQQASKRADRDRAHDLCVRSER